MLHAPTQAVGKEVEFVGCRACMGGRKKGRASLRGVHVFKGGVGRAATLVGGTAPRVEAEAISAAHTHSGCKFAQ